MNTFKVIFRIGILLILTMVVAACGGSPSIEWNSLEFNREVQLEYISTEENHITNYPIDAEHLRVYWINDLVTSGYEIRVYNSGNLSSMSAGGSFSGSPLYINTQSDIRVVIRHQETGEELELFTGNSSDLLELSVGLYGTGHDGGTLHVRISALYDAALNQ